MAHDPSPFLWCLTHQLPEDQATPLGVFCPFCKQRLYTAMPQGRLGAFWESQPGAYAPDGRPMFVFTLMWDDFRIRALHPPDSHEDERGARAREYERQRLEREAAAGRVDESLVPLEDDFSHLSATFGDASLDESSDLADDPGTLQIPGPGAAWSDAEADAQDEAGDDAEDEAADDEPEERWLDLPEPESWLDIGWKPEGED